MKGIGELLGVNVKRVEVDTDGQHYLRFVPQWGEPITFVAEGDCCSESWFADVLGVGALFGEEITGVQILEMPDVDQADPRNRQESTDAYGFRLTTVKGQTTIAFRNSSNGYYGGWIERAKSTPAKLTWEPIVSDNWSA